MRALEAARFAKRGSRRALVMPEGASDRQLSGEGRITTVERRVDELHERFDRLEKLLEKLASSSDR